MVKFYDENYKEVYLPGDSGLHYGSIPLELTISSIQMEKAGGKSKPVGRTASLRGAIIASDDIDMDMKMDNVMTFLRRLGEFYVAKANTPFKLLKVEVLDSYDIEPGNGVLTEFVVPLNVLKPFYKQSLHTTGTIGSEGMLFNNKWAYGMGTWFAENYWQYEFSGVKPTFYNAGDEEVKLIQQKESMITLKLNAVPTNGLIDIDDGTTTFKLWYDFKAGDVIRIHGDRVTLNGKNVLGDTNFNFLTVKTGWNYWDVRGVPNREYEFKIDFRYLYD